MKKLTKSQIKKSVRHAMACYSPSELRRWYCLGNGGIAPEIGFIKSAMMDYEPTGECTNISIYVHGDAMNLNHYYQKGCIDITDYLKRYLNDVDYNREMLINDLTDILAR